MAIRNNIHEYGNKFVIAEHFVDREGNPVDEEQFDVRRMCYSMFVAPIRDNGRHKNVIPYHQSRGFAEKIGTITGGGIITVNEAHTLEVGEESEDFMREPPFLRAQFAKLLLENLTGSLNASDLTLAERVSSRTDFYAPRVNSYWLRYSQVLEAARAGLDCSDFDDKIQDYRRDQEKLARASSQPKR